SFGLAARRRPGFPGVWVGDDKIASVGIHVRNWVTRHGVALNVAVQAEHFSMIRPCGLPVRAVSMNERLAAPAAWDDVERRLASETADLLGRRLVERSLREVGEGPWAAYPRT
ncbi:MAG: hypothetical protein AB1778_07935, partial [Candidatus Bipolaricaulota bacterium]